MTEREWIEKEIRKRMRQQEFGADDIADFVLAEIAAAERRGAEAMRGRCKHLQPSMPTLAGNIKDNPMESQGRGFWIGVRAYQAAVAALEVPAPATDAGEKEAAP